MINIFRKKRFLILLSVTFFSLALVTLAFPSSAHAMTPVWKTLQTDPDIQRIWKNVMNTVNALVIVILIVIAFAQILRLKIDTYGFKRMLPALIFGIIAANFSYLICRLLLDLANIGISLFLDFSQNNGLSQTAGTYTFKANWYEPFGTATTDGSIMHCLLNIIFNYVGAIFVLILAYLLIIRNWVIYFLVVLGPLAFMANVIPQGKTVFNQWWSNFLKWSFMPVVSIFWLWLGSQWINRGAVGSFAFSDTTNPDNAIYMKFIFAIVCLYLAITTPWKMGGGIMSQWGNLGKKAWGGAWKNTGGKWLENKTTDLKTRAARWYWRTAQRGAPTENSPINPKTGKRMVPLKERFIGQTFGRYARRQKRIETIRGIQKLGVETAQDSAVREAFGGKQLTVYKRNAKGELVPEMEDILKWMPVMKTIKKLDKDGKEIEVEVPDTDDNGNVKMVQRKIGERIKTTPRFGSREYQELIGQLIDDVNSDGGEKDWMMLMLDNYFMRTDAGKISAARKFTYQERMKGAKSEQETNAAEMLGIAAAGGSEAYENHPVYGREWKREYKEGEAEAKRLQIIKMSADKLQKDASDEDEVNAIGLNQIKTLFDTLSLAIRKNTKEMQRLGVDVEHLDDTQKQAALKTLTGRITGYDSMSEKEKKTAAIAAGLEKEYTINRQHRIEQEQADTRKLWNTHVSQLKIVDTSTRQILAKFPWLTRMLSQAARIDASGKLTVDIGEARDLGTSLGVTPEILGMVEDRLTKRESILANEELSSTQSKRDGLESRHEILGGTYSDEQLKNYMRGGEYLMSIDSHMRRKLRSEENNALQKAGPAGTETFMRDQELMAEWFYDWARKNTTSAQEYRDLNRRAHEGFMYSIQEGVNKDVTDVRRRMLEGREVGGKVLGKFDSESAVFDYIKQHPEEFGEVMKTEFGRKWGITEDKMQQLFDFSKVDIDENTGATAIDIRSLSEEVTDKKTMDDLSGLEQRIYTKITGIHRNDRERSHYAQAMAARIKELAPTRKEMGKEDEDAQKEITTDAGLSKDDVKALNRERRERQTS